MYIFLALLRAKVVPIIRIIRHLCIGNTMLIGLIVVMIQYGFRFFVIELYFIFQNDSVRLL